MNERMKKLRDELAKEIFDNYNPNADEHFVHGFNAAHDLLMKDVSVLLSTLELLSEHEPSWCDDFLRAKASLDEWKSKHE